MFQAELGGDRLGGFRFPGASALGLGTESLQAVAACLNNPKKALKETRKRASFGPPAHVA